MESTKSVSEAQGISALSFHEPTVIGPGSSATNMAASAAPLLDPVGTTIEESSIDLYFPTRNPFCFVVKTSSEKQNVPGVQKNLRVRPRRWIWAALSLLTLWWVPIMIKLSLSGNLGCGDIGCGENFQVHQMKHVGHFVQGILISCLLLPWAPLSSVDEYTCNKRVVILYKNVALLLVGITYPTYNIVKRSLTSKTEGHPESFFNSSYFLNSMDLTIGFTVGLIMGGVGLLIGTVGDFKSDFKRYRFSHMECNSPSFRWCAGLLVAWMLALDIGALALTFVLV